MHLALSILVSTVPLLLCYAARWWLGRDRLQPVWIFPVLVMAGGLGGLLFGSVLSPNLEVWFLDADAPGARSLLLTAVVVPLAEEVGKGLVLIVFLATRWFRSAVDGLLYGFAAGAGFAMVENVLHFLAAYSRGGELDWVASVVVRLPASLVIHGGATAIVGAYLGAARWERRALVVFAALPAALFVATAIHGGWNALLELGAVGRGAGYQLGAFALLPAVAIALVVLLALSVRAESNDVRQELMTEVAAGTLSAAELNMTLSRRARRDRRRGELARIALALAYALRRLRMEGRGREELDRLRGELARLRA